MAQNAHTIFTIFDGKEKNGFYCPACDYTCYRKCLWKQHIQTKKHQNNTLNETTPNWSSIYKCSKNMQHHKKFVCACGKAYKHIQSFNRHKKLCRGKNKEPQEITLNKCRDKNKESQEKELRAMISNLINQNQEILTENKEMRDMLRDMIPKIGNNTTINNKFNLQIFLNEHCKDAINLSEFVDTLELGVSDLDKTHQHGYITGISSIIVRGLKELDLHKRPIHCSDLKREVLYVKENDIWERESENKQNLKQAIASVANKQFHKIKDWENNNPGWENSEKGTQKYIELIKEVTSGTDTDDDKSTNRIIKSIAKEVIIEK